VDQLSIYTSLIEADIQVISNYNFRWKQDCLGYRIGGVTSRHASFHLFTSTIAFRFHCLSGEYNIVDNILALRLSRRELLLSFQLLLLLLITLP